MGYGHVLKPQLRTLDFVRIFGVSIADMAESYHLMATFILYTVCFVLLVLSLSVTTHRKRAADSAQMKALVEYQLSQFAYSQVALVIIVGQSSFMIENLFHGTVWWCIPALLVIINDIAAYICGKWWGRTSLIVLSPKKTVEGFVGAIVLTVLAGVLLAHYVVRSPAMVCSLYNTDGTSKGFNWTVPLLGVGPSTVDACDDEFTHSGMYRTQPVHELAPALASIPFARSLPEISPFQVHTAVLSLFASIIAPFGGFFASAVKRAFGIKDWGDTIPGQGGFNDRFDCQLMMHAFVGVYYVAFVKQSTTSTISALLSMPPEQQQRALCARVVQDSIAEHVGSDIVAGMHSFCAGAIP